MPNPLLTIFHALTDHRFDPQDWRSIHQRQQQVWQQVDREARQVIITLSHYHYRTFDLTVGARLLAQDSLRGIFSYRHFTKPKKDGSPRQLVEPDPKLKDVQQRILTKVLKFMPLHPAAKGFRRRSSTVDHAGAHAGAELIISADVRDFFPSTKAWRVEQWWRTRYESEQAARLLTLLTTYQDALPQGAPTSPALSNMVNYELDTALANRAQATGGTYTRYCDDLAFSWRLGFAPDSDFEAGVRAALRGFGYDLHGWRVWSRDDQPQLTGIVLRRDGTLDVPAEMHALIRRLRRAGDDDSSRLEGYEGYLHMVTGRKPRPAAPLRPASPALKARAPVIPPRRAEDYDDEDDDYDDD